MTMTPKIRIRDLHKSFGSKHVLRGVNLDVMPGQSVVVLGGSGTGKSVLLKCIIGLIEPDQGTIEIDGVDITHKTGKDRDLLLQKFGMLFQGGALFDSLPVWRNIAFRLLHNEKVSTDQARKVAEKALLSVGLTKEALDLSPSELSGGMQKRVGLARAIASKPEILFFDEPTTGLDPLMCGVIDSLIRSCITNLGATGMTITHDLTSARFIADKIAMIKEGEIIWEGSVKEMDRSKNKDVYTFIHGHETNQQQGQSPKPKGKK
jgi:phospholipid/cholesterol/gamma-HCH transport system ATP-binding protein